MTRVQQYIDAGFIYENPENPDEVIFTVTMRIAKATVEAGAFELSAMTAGWHPENPEAPLAPQVCIDGIKRFATEQMLAGLKQQILGQAYAQYEAIAGSLA